MYTTTGQTIEAEEISYMDYGEMLLNVLFTVLGTLLGVSGTLLAVRRHSHALKTSTFTEEVLVVTNIVEQSPEGVWYLKPRTVISEKSVSYHFPNTELARLIVNAAHQCNEASDTAGQFIRLDSKNHPKLMKRVVNIASPLATSGHVLRMCGKGPDKNDAYCCFTFSPYGNDDNILRIDIISAEDLKRFSNPNFVATLNYRAEEGSHRDNADIFAVCAQAVFLKTLPPDVQTARDIVRRVSLPTPR